MTFFGSYCYASEKHLAFYGVNKINKQMYKNNKYTIKCIKIINLKQSNNNKINQKYYYTKINNTIINMK